VAICPTTTTRIGSNTIFEFNFEFNSIPKLPHNKTKVAPYLNTLFDHMISLNNTKSLTKIEYQNYSKTPKAQNRKYGI